MTTATKERGILMHARSVNGILAGRKTQTRRIIKPQPYLVPSNGTHILMYMDRKHTQRVFNAEACSYGQPGDQLWVRETWKRQTVDSAGQHVAHRAHGAVHSCARWPCDVAADRTTDNKWRPSLHMPRCYSRITLEITDIRVERVQDIDWWDAIAEGVKDPRSIKIHLDRSHPRNPVNLFAQLWDDTNGKGAWDRNDWCWVVEFKRVGA